MRERLVFLLLGVTTTLTLAQPSFLNKKDIEAMMAANCALQCNGEISNDFLEQMCTCVSRSGVFIYGKRDGLSSRQRKLQDDTRELERLETVRDGQRKGAVSTRELIEMLNGGKKTTSPAFGSNLGDLLRRIPGMAHTMQPSTAQDGSDALFRSEIGADTELATKDDYLKWVEQEMKITETRLLKLIKFYKIIKATQDM